MAQKNIERGLPFILSSPSGAGKTTLTRSLLRRDPRLVASVSTTTRPPRPGEREGVDYFFLSEAAFAEQEMNGAFLETARVFSHRYGTPRAFVEEKLGEGKDVLFDIDWQGAQKLDTGWERVTHRIFILPPSYDVLHARLKQRGQDAADTIDARMRAAKKEISHWAEYDYIVINDDLDTACATIEAIIRSCRAQRRHQPGLTGFVAALLA